MKKIAVLTGGGDVPGLNPVVKTLTYRAFEDEHNIMGFCRGWAGLLNYNPDDPEGSKSWMMALDKLNTRRIDREGGTFLHTSRTNPGKVQAQHLPEFLKSYGEDVAPNVTLDMTPHVLRVLESLKVDVLIAIGGEDTLGYAARIHREGFPVVSIPKTMDNDVFGSDYCIGFSTAITRSVAFIHQLRTSIGSHERLGVIELFGRHSGETALIAAYLAWADRALICEAPYESQRLADFLMTDREANPSHYALVVVSEGAREAGGQVILAGEPDAFGHKKLGGVGQYLSDTLHRLTGVNTLYQSLAYLMRSGTPDSLDLMVAVNYAHMAMDLVGKGVYGRMVALKDGQYTSVEADMPLRGVKQVDVAQFYDVDTYRPKVKQVQNKPMFLY